MQRRPRAGGGYVYLRETWGPLPAFLYGWALLLVIASGAIAAIAVTFADYTLALTGLPRRLALPLAIGAIVLVSGDQLRRCAARRVVQNVFTVLKLLALAALVGVGLLAGLPPSEPSPAAAPSAIGAALVPVLFTYGGWQQTNFIAEEMVNPERDLPRALLLGVAIVVATYLLANLAYLQVLGPRRPGRQHRSGCRRDAAGARPCRRHSHLGGDRHQHLRVSQPGRAGDAARLPGDGGGRCVLPPARPAAPGASYSGRRDRVFKPSGPRPWRSPGASASWWTTSPSPTGSSSG